MDYIGIIYANEATIRTEIRKQMESNTAYDILIMFDPENEGLDFDQDDGSWKEHDQREFLARIDRDLLTEIDAEELKTAANIEEWNNIEDFEVNEAGKLCVEEIIDRHFENLVSQVNDKIINNDLKED